MSASLAFEIKKSSDEVRDYAVEFVKKDPTASDYTLTGGDVTATKDGVDVTADAVDNAHTRVSGNILTLRTKAYGASGDVILVKATGTTDDDQTLSAWGTIVVIDPSVS